MVTIHAGTAGRSPFGVLVIHGFTANRESVELLLKPLQSLGIPVSIPVLAGHGGPSPAALKGLRWQDWLNDAEAAFRELAERADRIIVVGHSMGALLALNLAVRHPGKVDALVLVATAIRLVSVLAPGRPLHFAAFPISLMVKRWGLKSVFADPEGAVCRGHYEWVPTDAVLSFFRLIRKTQKLLAAVHCPVFILHNRSESTVLPESVGILNSSLGTPDSDRSVLWLSRSGHQVFCDCEREDAVEAIVRYVSGRMGRSEER
ncbi:alpha/beta hydrolase [Pelodictyon luteolum]|uniref:Lysophospholipase L2, putative n=1 Tax=Chlorobium luteolum (strain DSM 273 / BCRC 81028 / 2530) TaxID=319225 RepID=Q3B153_CHLL3|nr:alpha/beta fold hydrolase [Pelodictyon luteolum]ABB24928.1 lysophospholipase L2, putative [Pelodictyon luteolum DSM 273]